MIGMIINSLRSSRKWRWLL